MVAAVSDMIEAVSTPTLPTERPAWLARYQRGLVVLDGALLVVAIGTALTLRSSIGHSPLNALWYSIAALLLGGSWWAALGLSRSYEARFLGEGPEEFKRVAQAAVRVAASVGVVCFLGKVPLSRGFLALALPLGTVLLLTGRFAARGLLHRRRRQGAWMHRVLLVGAGEQLQELTAQFDRAVVNGFEVVGAWTPAGEMPDLPVPSYQGMVDVETVVAAVGADTVAVAAWPGISPEFLRAVSHDLETSTVDLVVAPSLLDATGSRVAIHPAAGLPLLRLDDVELSGVGRAVKGVLDRLLALLAVVALSPALLACIVAVAVSPSTNVLVGHPRLGRDGKPFELLRFDTGDPRPEDRRGALTRVGRFLQTHGLDDLPSLINVIRGDMSLVGPRPVHAQRRRSSDVVDERLLRVKPGLTGLSQISGRTLSPQESLHLDQQYVDSWSLSLDALVLFKTFGLMARGRGLS